MNLAFFLEEPSAREMLKGLLPRLLSPQVIVRYVVFEGKHDLNRNLLRKLRGWRTPDTAFVILQDQDSDDCKALKDRLARKCAEAGRSSTKVRIACRELESWYFGDLAAVERGLEVSRLQRYASRRQYRIPDSIHVPSAELRKITRNAYQKVAGSRAIGAYMTIDGNTSDSFRAFIGAVRSVVATTAAY